LNQLLDNFEKSDGNTAIFVLSDRFTLPSGEPGAIQPNDPRWEQFVSEVGNSNKVFSNGHVQVYQHLSEQ
jgi:hypothetical protein